MSTDLESSHMKPDQRLSNLTLCPKCDQKAREIDKLYDRELKNLQYLLNFKDLAVRKRDEMVLNYVEEIKRLKETINNLNKLIYRLKLQIPDPRNLTNTNSYLDSQENEFPMLIGQNNRPVSSVSTQKRMFSAVVLKKNQSHPIVKIISKDFSCYLRNFLIFQ